MNQNQALLEPQAPCEPRTWSKVGECSRTGPSHMESLQLDRRRIDAGSHQGMHLHETRLRRSSYCHRHLWPKTGIFHRRKPMKLRLGTLRCCRQTVLRIEGLVAEQAVEQEAAPEEP